MEYTREDSDRLKKELAGKTAVFGFIGVAVMAGLAVLFTLRLQLLTCIVTVVAGIPYMFFWTVYMTPPLKYRKMLADMRTGQQRVSEGEFLRCEEAVRREGLVFVPIIIQSEHEGEMMERRLYWDAEKQLPDFKPGERLELTTYGQIIKKARRL